jgi:hypothetical protein
MKKPNFVMMQSGLRLLFRSVKLLVHSFPNRRSMQIRANQCVICCKAIFKGLIGREGDKA